MIYRSLSCLLISCVSVAWMPARAADEAIVSRGEATILPVDVDARLVRVPATKRAGFMNDPDRIEGVLQELLIKRQVAVDAEKANLEKDPVIAAAVRLAVEDALAKIYLSKELAAIPLPDFELIAEERYLSNPESFTDPETRSVRHLVILNEKHGPAEARKLAEQAHARAVADSSAFEQLVVEVSEEKSAAEAKGRVDSLLHGQSVGPFDRAAFALTTIGEISPLVETSYGFHVIQLLAIRPASKRPFADVKAEIVEGLTKEFRDRKRAEMIESYRSVAMHANADEVLKLRKRYLPEGEGTRALGKIDTAEQAESTSPAQ